jgi:hypothetical protein
MRGWGWSAGIAVELATSCRERGGKLGSATLLLGLTFGEFRESGLASLVASGEVADGRFEPADHIVEAGGFGSDVSVPAVTGVSFPLTEFRELAGGLAAVPAPLTVLHEPFDLAALVSRSGQLGDGTTDGCVPVGALT